MSGAGCAADADDDGGEGAGEAHPIAPTTSDPAIQILLTAG
jgi:hypothetical protein